MKKRYSPVVAGLIGAMVAGCSGSKTPIVPNADHAKNLGEVSGGTDQYVVDTAFYRSLDSHKQITVCAEIAKDFGVPAGDVESTLRWAFRQWTDYIEQKDLTYAQGQGSAGIVGNLAPMKDHCTGGEDLRVYLGVQNPDVDHYRARYINPYAFTAMTSPDTYADWHQGLLWFAGTGTMNAQHTIPTWNLKSRVPYGAFKYAMLHEVGHIFGNGHVERTIMQAWTATKLKDWTNSAPGRDTFYSEDGPDEHDLSIDQGLELVPNLNLAGEYSLATGYGVRLINGVWTGDNDALAHAYERVFGEKPKGKLSATALREEKPNRVPHAKGYYVDGGTGDLVVTFRDGDETRTATIHTTAKVAQKDESTPLFDGQYGNHFRTFGLSLIGELVSDNGQRFPVLVSYNMGVLLEVIDLQGDGDRAPLLSSMWKIR